ncbi:MAG: hypothetical protein WDM78_20215 [Puia sp.]
MRTELELIEKIERYLTDQLSTSEKKQFEEQINADPKLLEEVRLQQEVMKGIGRAALKQEVRNAGIRFGRGRNFTRWGSAGFIVLVIIAVVFYYQKTSSYELSYKGKGGFRNIMRRVKKIGQMPTGTWRPRYFIWMRRRIL